MQPLPISSFSHWKKKNNENENEYIYIYQDLNKCLFFLKKNILEAAYVWLKITITIGEEHYLL